MRLLTHQDSVDVPSRVEQLTTFGLFGENPLIETIESQTIKRIIAKIAETMRKQKDYLSRLDAAIGDGDHGVSMVRGFNEAELRLDRLEYNRIGPILKNVGITLTSTIGGATGPLFGSIFLKAGQAAGEKEEINLEDLAQMFQASLNGVVGLGKAKVGEKTLVDALSPAVESLKKSLKQKKSLLAALEDAVLESKKGAESTRDIAAGKGRATYLGERAVGHIDPGAMSVYFILKSFYDIIKT